MERRRVPANALTADAEPIAAACHAMAGRFHLGGRKMVFGVDGSAADAAHVVVEFVHPVIVGKPALSFALSGPWLAGRSRMLADPADIALDIAAGVPDGKVTGALREARLGGLLTVGLFGEPDAGCSAEHTPVVRAAAPLVIKEVQATTYHVRWELVHVFLERPEVLS